MYKSVIIITMLFIRLVLGKTAIFSDFFLKK